MELDSQPRVLLGNLEPIVLIGMTRVLGEAGADVIGHEQHPSQIVTQAGRLGAVTVAPRRRKISGAAR